ncbi:MAG: MFS transporter, partial [Halobacteriales archaeon]|nr:MFS transporter [Halobacteriales archaeon]
ALTALGSGLLSWAPGYVAFTLAAVFLGAGAGLYFSAATTFVAGLFENTGWALGIHSAGGPLAGLVAPLLGTVVAARFGWRPALLVGAAVAGPVLVAYATLIPSTLSSELPKRQSSPVSFQTRDLLGIIRRGPVAFTSGLAVAGYFSWQAVLSFFPAFLIAFHDLTPGQASLGFAGLFVMSAVGLPVLGRLSDRFRRDVVLGMAFSISAAAMSLLVLGTGSVAIGLGVVFLGGGMGWAGVLNSRFMDLFGDRERGTAFGLVRTVFLLLGSLGSVVTGVLVDASGWTVAYGMVAVVLVVGMVAIVANRTLGLEL